MTQTYIGTKIVTAWPESKRVVINEETGETETMPGYSVKYEDGYISWFPKEIFERTYKSGKDANMDFGQALQFMKLGHKVARKGWSNQNMFIFLIPGSEFIVNREPLKSVFWEGAKVNYQAHIDMKTASGAIAVWTPSICDITGEDWYISEVEVNVVGE